MQVLVICDLSRATRSIIIFQFQLLDTTNVDLLHECLANPEDVSPRLLCRVYHTTCLRLEKVHG